MAVHPLRVFTAQGGHPQSRNNEVMDQVREKVLEDRRITIQEIAGEV